MTDNHHLKISPLAQIILQAEQELLSPYKFYYLCQQVSQQSNQKRLYFYTPDSGLLDLKNGIGSDELRKFLDYLARYLRINQNFAEVSQVSRPFNYLDRQDACATNDELTKTSSTNCQAEARTEQIFYLKKVSIKINSQIKKVLFVQTKLPNYSTKISKNTMKFEVEIYGSGMVGRVAKIRINDKKDLAFKAFFDPEFVWQHGPWAEIPIGIRLKYRQVTKNMPEFLFAGQDWAVWEWIYPDTKPESRAGGITYEELAEAEGLTRLNPLNLSNYNPHNMRLDPGGIQKEYLGRRFHDLIRSVIFYIRKYRREGWKSLTPYLSQKMIRYMFIRLVALVNPGVTEKR